MEFTAVLFSVLETARVGASTSIFWSFVAGALYGLTCIQCILPIAFYGSAEGNVRKGALFALYFNLPRLVLFLILAVIAALSASVFLSVSGGGLPPIILVLFHLVTGLVLIFFSAELFGLFDFDKVIVVKLVKILQPSLSKDFSAHWYGAFLRGLLFSIACALESVALVFAIWFLGLSDSLAFREPAFAFMAVLSYGVGNILSTTLAAAFMGGSTGLIENRTKLKIRKYVSIFGSMILLFMGLILVSDFVHYVLWLIK